MARTETKTLLLASLLAASLTSGNAQTEPGQEIAPGVRLVARISDLRIQESSGIVVPPFRPRRQGYAIAAGAPQQKASEEKGACRRGATDGPSALTRSAR